MALKHFSNRVLLWVLNLDLINDALGTMYNIFHLIINFSRYRKFISYSYAVHLFYYI